jgi:hypothetical protein
MSESLDQVQFTEQLHPSCRSDPQVHDQAGLLTTSILLHGLHLVFLHCLLTEHN